MVISVYRHHSSKETTGFPFTFSCCFWCCGGDSDWIRESWPPGHQNLLMTQGDATEGEPQTDRQVFEASYRCSLHSPRKDRTTLSISFINAVKMRRLPSRVFLVGILGKCNAVHQDKIRQTLYHSEEIRCTFTTNSITTYYSMAKFTPNACPLVCVSNFTPSSSGSLFLGYC